MTQRDESDSARLKAAGFYGLTAAVASYAWSVGEDAGVPPLLRAGAIAGAIFLGLKSVGDVE